MLICSKNEVTATIGLQPAGVRVQVDGGGLIDPGRSGSLAGSQDSVSFRFVVNTSTFEGNDNHAFDAQWRSPTGGSVTMIKGVMNLQHENGTTGC